MIIKNKPNNINTKKYWDYRYQHNWRKLGGEDQTKNFFEYILTNLPSEIKKDIKNKRLVDSSCAFGQGVYILSKAFPLANISGVEFSEIALKECKKNYPKLKFERELNGKYFALFSSNTLEHCDYPLHVLHEFIKFVNRYCIILVPYKENPTNRINEHVYSFYDNDFPTQILEFRKIFQKEIFPEHWTGSQLLVIYKKTMKKKFFLPTYFYPFWPPKMATICTTFQFPIKPKKRKTKQTKIFERGASGFCRTCFLPF